MTTPGKLYIVATPLGNLGDITYRAIETLKSVDFIACEDTRTSRVLLDHYGIHKPTIAYHNFNERAIAEKLLDRITAGESAAIISDAGTPTISDPGFVIVRAAVARNITIVAIPGPAAATAALSVSGLPTDAFIFYGFLPQTAGKRAAVIKSLADRRETLIFYESPFKIHKLLDLLHEILGNRQIVICRELTKKFEEVLRSDLESIRTQLTGKILKGELTIVVQGLVRNLGSEAE